MRTYIIHVSTNLEREKHMMAQIEGIGYDFVFVNDGDKEAITPEIANKYFTNGMENVWGGTSCAYKHILAYEDMAQNGIKEAIILEDDIFLSKNFVPAIESMTDEIKRRELKNLLVSLEDSIRKFVKGSDIIKGQMLYKNTEGRFTGAYLLDLACAKSMLDEIKQNRCGRPIDHFHNICAARNIINIYWAHPTIATQGSSSGKIASMLERDKQKRSIWRIIEFYIGYAYKKLLWRAR